MRLHDLNAAGSHPDSSPIPVFDRRAWLLVSALLCLCCAPALAQQTSDAAASQPAPSNEASASELARARTLFQRGVALADQGQFGVAAARFRDALAIHPAPAVEYNLAAALFELRQYSEAFNGAQRVLQDASSPASLREHAEKLQRSLYPYVARLTVTASSTAEESVAVSIDGQPLDPGLMGVPRAVTPGTHQVSAERKGDRVSEREVQVPLRTAVIVDVSLIVTEQESERAVVTSEEVSAPVLSPAPPVRADKTRDDSSRRRRIWLWSGLAAGVVAVAAGVTLALVLRNDEASVRPAASGDFMPGALTWK